MVKATSANPGRPFELDDEEAWLRWRDRKLANAPARLDDVLVEIRDPRSLRKSEHEAIRRACGRANMAIYASPLRDEDKNLARQLGRQFGLQRLDGNWLADEDGITSIRVDRTSERQSYIPYTDKPIKWHTDGYYNAPGRKIHAMILHCVRPAEHGGLNSLMDHEMAYLLLRERNPEWIRALMAPDVMMIPERSSVHDGRLVVERPANTGAVFTADRCGSGLHMRYTARTRSIAWKADARVADALACLGGLLAGSAAPVFRVRLEAGMGLICANVLHDRSAFTDGQQATGEAQDCGSRLLYRARYLDRLACAGWASDAFREGPCLTH